MKKKTIQYLCSMNSILSFSVLIWPGYYTEVVNQKMKSIKIAKKFAFEYRNQSILFSFFLVNKLVIS